MKYYTKVRVHGYYRHVYILTYENGKEVKKKVRKWIEPHWRKIIVKEKEKYLKDNKTEGEKNGI